jgi:hypothetical protein
MDHNYITIEEPSKMQRKVINQKDNNIDKLDNLHELPQGPAVFAVCGRVNGQAANPRYVGATSNLRATIADLFNKTLPAPEGNTMFKDFMLSIKIKELVFELLTDASVEEREKKKNEWEEKFRPMCTPELNEIH